MTPRKGNFKETYTL